MITVNEKFKRRQKRNRFHINNKKSEECLRLTVFKSNYHIYAQIIDDVKRQTLVSASTLNKDFKSHYDKSSTIKAAELIGRFIAEKALAKGITRVVLDRGGNLYHGRIKALAENARQNGLIF